MTIRKEKYATNAIQTLYIRYNIFMSFTPSQASKYLGIPPSTLRKYAGIFSSHLSPQTTRKKRLYTSRDLLVFQKIKDLSANGLPLGDISLVLAGLGSDLPSETIQSPGSVTVDHSPQLEEVLRLVQSTQNQNKLLIRMAEEQEKKIAQLQDDNISFWTFRKNDEKDLEKLQATWEEQMDRAKKVNNRYGRDQRVDRDIDDLKLELQQIRMNQADKKDVLGQCVAYMVFAALSLALIAWVISLAWSYISPWFSSVLHF